MIKDIYSKRQKRLRGGNSDVYIYDQIPMPLKVQIAQIMQKTLGTGFNDSPNSASAYQHIVETLRAEYGVFNLSATGRRSYVDELFNFFLQEANVDESLDVIEFAFEMIDTVSRQYDFRFTGDASTKADIAIKELNIRFKEHGIGYQYTNKLIVRIDSEFLHAEVVIPALRLLNQNHYRGAEEEFLQAHDHYRKGNQKEALNECLKAFESVMKAICDKRKWAYPAGATAKALIDICLDKQLIPSFWQSHFGALRALLESSVPTTRNKLSGHGQGSTPQTVPDYLVAYMLHMTGAAIVCLAEAESNMP